MAVHDAKIKSTAKDSTTGIGGPHTKGVTANSHKVPVKKANSSTQTQTVEAPDAFANQNGTFTIGLKRKNVSNKNLPDPVRPDNTLLTTPRRAPPNVIASKTTFLTPRKALVLNNLPEDRVRMANQWWNNMENFNVIVDRI